jgi:hypothetical protein
MNVAERVGNVSNELKSKAQQARFERVDDSNEELKHENKLLRDQLEEDSANRDRMVAALDRMEMTPRKRKRGGWIRTILVAGVAYVLGTRAGRERYMQIQDAVGRMLKRTPLASENRAQDVAQMAETSIGSAAQTGRNQVGQE